MPLVLAVSLVFLGILLNILVIANGDKDKNKNWSNFLNNLAEVNNKEE